MPDDKILDEGPAHSKYDLKEKIKGLPEEDDFLKNFAHSKTNDDDDDTPYQGRPVGGP